MYKKTLIVLLCITSVLIFSRPNKEGDKLSFIGSIVSFGSEPNILVMIKDLDGNLYYPKDELQEVVKDLPRVTYKWTGYMLGPESPLPGLIPKHKGIFKEIEWEVYNN